MVQIRDQDQEKHTLATKLTCYNIYLRKTSNSSISALVIMAFIWPFPYKNKIWKKNLVEKYKSRLHQKGVTNESLTKYETSNTLDNCLAINFILKLKYHDLGLIIQNDLEVKNIDNWTKTPWWYFFQKKSIPIWI
jgi:hypothetical protein